MLVVKKLKGINKTPVVDGCKFKRLDIPGDTFAMKVNNFNIISNSNFISYNLNLLKGITLSNIRPYAKVLL